MEDTKWKSLLHVCSIAKININKMLILLKAICTFSVIPVRIPRAFFSDPEKNNDAKMHVDTQETLKN